MSGKFNIRMYRFYSVPVSYVCMYKNENRTYTDKHEYVHTRANTYTHANINRHTRTNKTRYINIHIFVAARQSQLLL